jgi:hypothetical protein
MYDEGDSNANSTDYENQINDIVLLQIANSVQWVFAEEVKLTCTCCHKLLVVTFVHYDTLFTSNA